MDRVLLLLYKPEHKSGHLTFNFSDITEIE